MSCLFILNSLLRDIVLLSTIKWTVSWIYSRTHLIINNVILTLFVIYLYLVDMIEPVAAIIANMVANVIDEADKIMKTTCAD